MIAENSGLQSTDKARLVTFRFLKKLAANEGCRAALILVAILQIGFYPCFWQGKTLLTSAEEAPSILHHGADTDLRDNLRLSKLRDPGGAAWQIEPWLAFIRDQYREGTVPLWDPGTHVVKFEYRPASFYWGTCVSILSCSFLALFALTAKTAGAGSRLFVSDAHSIEGAPDEVHRDQQEDSRQRPA